MTCEVVSNQALGKEFLYCRTHRQECSSTVGCLSYMPSTFSSGKRTTLSGPQVGGRVRIKDTHPLQQGIYEIVAIKGDYAEIIPAGGQSSDWVVLKVMHLELVYGN